MYLITKISLIITFIMMMGLIAETFGFIDRKYGDYIFIIGLIIQSILLAFFILIISIRKGQLKRAIKILRYQYEDIHVKGETDILPKYITPTNPRKSSIFKIYFEIKDFKNDEPPDFGIFTMGKGPIKIADIKKHMIDVNIGVSNNLFVFNADIIVRPDQQINFKFKKDTSLKTFFVGELYIP